MSPARISKTRPFLINASGFTLGQLLASLTIISVVAFFVAAVYSVFGPIKSRQESFYCARNLEQISMAMLQYIQDYDEKFPPCAQPTAHKNVFTGWAAVHYENGQSVAFVRPDNQTTAASSDQDRGGLLEPYLKSAGDFSCFALPAKEVQNAHFYQVDYMYNDLAAGVAQKDFAAPDKTVLVCDGEDFAGNVGHAYDPDHLPGVPLFSGDGAVVFGATLQTAPLRHNGGANYGYADGHVKWSKPKGIYFPLRQSDSRSHIDKHNGEVTGPDPTKLSAAGYIGTFHVK